MFGYSQIVRQVRKWRADRKRIAIQNVIQRLPIQLQKDIGWPALTAKPSVGRVLKDLRTCPTL